MSENELPNTHPHIKSNPIVATLLSLLLFGGAGQIYLGQIKKGILLIVLTLFLFSSVGFLIPLVGALDAYILAKKLKEGQPIGEWMFFSWEDLKKHQGNLVYLIIGFFGWFVGGTLVIVAIGNALKNVFELDNYILVSLAIQIIGLGITVFAFRYKLKWLAIGIICALFLYILGFFLVGGCGLPGLPFPLSIGMC